MQDQSTIDSHLLDILAPPAQFPPTQQSLLSSLESHFLQQCQNFIQKQKHLYKYSHKVQKKLLRIKENLNNLQRKIFSKGSASQTDLNNDKKQRKNTQNQEQSHIEKIFSELSKINENEKKFHQRQELLQVLCKHLRMQNFREVLITDKKSLQLQAQPIYLETLEELRQRLEQSDKLTPQKYSSLPLIESMRKQFNQIYKIAVQKILSHYLTPTMLDLLLKKYSKIFFVNRQFLSQFYDALVNNRGQHIKLGLYPLINTLNYAHNVADLYQSIVDKWIQMFRAECDRFKLSGIQPYTNQKQQNGSQMIHFPYMKMIESICRQTLNQFLPKLERNIYKIKQIQQIAKIRSCMRKLRFFFKNLIIQQQQLYENLETVIKKVSILLQEKIKEEAETLSTSKYNIYNLTSYIPIRQHLQSIKECIKIQQNYKKQQMRQLQQLNQNRKIEATQDKLLQPIQISQGQKNVEQTLQQIKENQQLNPNQVKEIKKVDSQEKSHKQQKLIEKDMIDWQLAIRKLTESRNPKSNFNNKSLIIFNLNTWFLYSKILKTGSLINTAREALDWSTTRFIQINMTQTTKIYFNEQKLQKILDNCSDIQALKKILYAELNLIGHQQLRKLITNGLQNEYIAKYQYLIKLFEQKVPNIKNGLKHQQVLGVCKQNKINLKKYGKLAEKLQIISGANMRLLIEYN